MPSTEKKFIYVAIYAVLLCIGILWCLSDDKEPTITLVSKDWECIAWRPVSLESVETECTVYWRVN